MKKKGNEKVIILLTILLFLILLYFCVNLFDLLKKKSVQAIALQKENIEIPEVLQNEHPIDIDKIIKQNKNIATREEMVYEEQTLEYTTQYINNEDLPSGTIQVSQIGMNGTQDVITIKKYNGDELISEKIVASNVKKASVNKIVEIGVGKRKKQIRVKSRRYCLFYTS